MKSTRTLLQFAFLIVFCMAIASPASAQSVQQSQVANPQTATGNGPWGSSRLNAQDRIAVEAPEVNGVTGQYGICRSIVNNGSRDIFVPWKTPLEWSAFLNAVANGQNNNILKNISTHQCCGPQTATVCGVSTNIQLGYRALGTVLQQNDVTPRDPNVAIGTLNNWGAEDDIYGPIYASQVLDNAQSNYQVTYVCDQGNWVKTHEIGSCTPLNGACNSPGYMTQLPSDLTTLCGPGSSFANLQATSTGWTWECDGTPGMSNALCQAYNNPPINGTCGPINNPTTNGPRYDSIAMNGMTNAMLCNTGTWAGSFSNSNGTGEWWQWSCNGLYGGNNSGTCYALQAVINGACGAANGHMYKSLLPGPTTNLCAEPDDTASVPIFDPLTQTWSWTCAGFGAGATTASCSANYNPTFTNGLCGPDNGGYFADGTLQSTDPNLCSSGTVGSFSGSSTQTPYWQWTCQGVSGGGSSRCGAYDVPQVNASCGPDNNGYFPGGLFANDPFLCSSGTPGNFSASASYNPYFYYWECTGSGGGQNFNCWAYNTNGLTSGQCGTANGVPSQNPPATNLCTTGIWTSVSRERRRHSVAVELSRQRRRWHSELQRSGAAALLANGVCGTANNTAIPNTPNFNLCSAGTPGTLNGGGPWNWICDGTGGGTNSGQCNAFLCQACTGTSTRLQTAPRSGHAWPLQYNGDGFVERGRRAYCRCGGPEDDHMERPAGRLVGYDHADLGTVAHLLPALLPASPRRDQRDADGQ